MRLPLPAGLPPHPLVFLLLKWGGSASIDKGHSLLFWEPELVLFFYQNFKFVGWECSSVVEHLSSMCKALDSTPALKINKWIEKIWMFFIYPNPPGGSYLMMASNALLLPVFIFSCSSLPHCTCFGLCPQWTMVEVMVCHLWDQAIRMRFQTWAVSLFWGNMGDIVSWTSLCRGHVVGNWSFRQHVKKADLVTSGDYSSGQELLWRMVKCLSGTTQESHQCIPASQKLHKLTVTKFHLLFYAAKILGNLSCSSR
jgi:hypothetical protein